MTTIATFIDYPSLDSNETRETGVVRISAEIIGHAGEWRWRMVFTLDAEIFGDAMLGKGPAYSSGRFYRHDEVRTFPTRNRAWLSLRSHLEDHFTVIPGEAVYKVNRGSYRPVSQPPVRQKESAQ